MAVFRTVKNENYTVMCNHHLTNKSLSLKAKGLLSLILALPDNWNYNTRGLASCSKDGVGSAADAVMELGEQGDIIRRPRRGSDGRIYDTEYTVYEIPQKKPHPSSPDTGNPDVVDPVAETPDSAVPVPEKPAVLNTKKSNKKKLNTDLSNTHGHSACTIMDCFDATFDAVFHPCCCYSIASICGSKDLFLSKEIEKEAG